MGSCCRLTAHAGYLRSTLSVSITVLKNRLGQYVRLAAGGEIVLVTNRGRVVAQFVPPQSGRKPSKPVMPSKYLMDEPEREADR
jgi:prevent-host-death family protein